MPELPEVHALTADMGSRLDDRIVEKLEIVSFAALKTFDPAPSALVGSTIVGVSRHGKFLDLTCVTKAAGDLHVIVHLARAGWIRWRDSAPGAALRRAAVDPPRGNRARGRTLRFGAEEGKRSRVCRCTVAPDSPVPSALTPFGR